MRTMRGRQPGYRLFQAARRWALLAVFVFALPAVSMAQDQRPLRGVALVIGQAQYKHLKPLPNPGNDADAIEALLSDLGFDSVRRTDRDAETLSRDLERFAEDAEDADVAVLYYSGHGIEAGGENFLIPVDADLSALDDAGEKLVPVSALIEKLKTTVPVAIVLLDACRDNPFPAGSELRLSAGSEPVAVGGAGLGLSRGAASLEPAEPQSAPSGEPGDENVGTVIAFAAEPGKVALDGDAGGNSPYAAALLRHFDAMAGEEFGTVMRMVAEEVYLKTGGEQRPWVNESLRRLLYFGEAPDPLAGDEGAILKERRQLLVTIAALPRSDQSRIERVARASGVPMDALYGVLRAMGADAPADPAELAKVLEKQAKELKQLFADRDTIARSDPEIERLAALTDTALAEGAIVKARQLRREVDSRIETLAASLDKVEANVLERRKEFAAEYARSAQVSALGYDHEAAAGYYLRAYRQVEGRDADLAFTYKRAQGKALYQHGFARGAPAVLTAAIEALDEAESQRSRETQEADWASARHLKILATEEIGVISGGEAGMRRMLDAVQLYRDLIDTAWTFEKDPDNWALANRNLGDLIHTVADRSGDNSLYYLAIEHYKRAQSVFTREKNERDWADAQANIAAAFSDLVEHDVEPYTTLEKAEAMYGDVLGIYKRGEYPEDWARLTIQLAGVIEEKGVRTKDSNLIWQAINSVQSALSEVSRERDPMNWATVQSNLGAFYSHLSDIQPDAEILRKAAAAHRLALEERTPDAAAIDWGVSNYNLANVLTDLGRLTHDPAYFYEAIEAYDNTLSVADRDADSRYFSRAAQNRTNPVAELFTLEKSMASAERGVTANAFLLDVFSKTASPFGWARFANNTGYFLTEKARFSHDHEDLRRAIELLEQAEQLWPESDPGSRHNTKENLCFALVEEAKLTKSLADARHAADYCGESLAYGKAFDLDTSDGLLTEARQLVDQLQ